MLQSLYRRDWKIYTRQDKGPRTRHSSRPCPDLHRFRARLHTGYYPLWDKVKFIDRDPHWYTRRVKEAIHGRLHPNNANRDSGMIFQKHRCPRSRNATGLIYKNTGYLNSLKISLFRKSHEKLTSAKVPSNLKNEDRNCGTKEEY